MGVKHKQFFVTAKRSCCKIVHGMRDEKRGLISEMMLLDRSMEIE